MNSQIRNSLAIAILITSFSASGFDLEPPACFSQREELLKVSDQEVLARLVFAEGLSTGCLGNADQDPAVFELLAYGVMNRVRLSERFEMFAKKYGSGVRGVVFQPKQFNPAVSSQSKYSRYFLCPFDVTRDSEDQKRLWKLAWQAAGKAVLRPSDNPFLLTEWEKKKGLSLVTHFYYPKSVQATRVPPNWVDVSENSRTWVRDVAMKDCLWFFRLERGE